MASAASKCSGNFLPRLLARRRIPAAAFGLKKYFGATDSSSTSRKDEDTPPPLGNSKEPGIENSPGEVIKPEVGQRPEDGREVPSASGTKKTRDVFDQKESAGANKEVCDSGEFEEQGGPLAAESCAPSGDGHVLAGEAAGE